jgi:hypothetical protein
VKFYFYKRQVNVLTSKSMLLTHMFWLLFIWLFMYRSCVDLGVFSCDQVRLCDTIDIANGLEAIPVTVNMPQHGNVTLFPFNYICNSIVSGKASLGTNVFNIEEEDCCYDYKRDCMTADRGYNCARRSRGKFAYTS